MLFEQKTDQHGVITLAAQYKDADVFGTLRWDVNSDRYSCYVKAKRNGKKAKIAEVLDQFHNETEVKKWLSAMLEGGVDLDTLTWVKDE